MREKKQLSYNSLSIRNLSNLLSMEGILVFDIIFINLMSWLALVYRNLSTILDKELFLPRIIKYSKIIKLNLSVK